MHSKTISVKNHQQEELTDRNIWADFQTMGFIRQIEICRSKDCIYFDTRNNTLDAIDIINVDLILIEF